MSKRLAGWVAWSFVGWAGFAHALGLGEIEARSRLNQQVAATIPILSASGAELDTVTVQLAANEDFERAGIDRSEFLSSLRFTVENSSIRVSSKQIAREPFVSFLLDVRWSGGRLLREYTMLLDPPAMAQQGTGISAPQATAIGEAMAPEIPVATPTDMPAEAPAEMGEAGEMAESPSVAEAGPESGPAETPMESPGAPPESAAMAAGGMYGPVAPQETLWSIAYKLRPDAATITMDQMQVAIFNANPKAFHDGSIRGLMKGSMLRIPSADEVRSVDAGSAKALVAAAREGGVVAVAPPRPVAEPVEAPVEAPQPAPPEPEPTVAESTPPPPTSEAVPPSGAAPSGAPPASEAAPAPVEPAPAPVEQPKPEPQPETKPAPSPQAAPIIAESPGILDTVVEAAKGAVADPMVQYGVAGLFGLIILAFVGKKVANKIAQIRYDRASKQVEAARTAPSAAAGSEDVTQVAEQSGSPSMQSALEAEGESPTVVNAPKLAATVAMGSDTMQQTMQQTQVQEPAQAATGSRGVDFDVTSNFASETVQINLDAGDPLSEAEFHRAYGLYDEAALMLKQALQKDPKRTDARVKLAEIYFEAGKANEFVEVAKELKGQLPDDKWQPIALMGSQIAAGNDLFSGAGAGAGTVDLSFDEPAMPAAAPAPAAPPAAAAPAGDSLEFDLGSLSLDAGAGAAPAPAAAPAAAPAGDALEFDLGALDVPAAPAAAPAPEPAAAPAAGGELSLDLGSFDVAAAPAASGSEGLELGAEPVAEPVADEAGTKLDLARAYLDMGDADMAKSLLNEVSQQGNDAQKKEAEELLKRASA